MSQLLAFYGPSLSALAGIALGAWLSRPRVPRRALDLLLVPRIADARPPNSATGELGGETVTALIHRAIERELARLHRAKRG